MKQIFKQLTAWGSAALLAGSFSAMPVLAADTDIYVETVCEGFDPVYDDTIVVNAPIDGVCSVTVVQHSPERENLLLYEGTFEGAAGTAYIFRAEPGDYTVSLTVDAVRNSAVKRTFSQDFTIENPDFVISDEAFFVKTSYIFDLTVTTVAGNAAADPERTEAHAEIADDVNTVTNSVNFKQYARFRGDFNGDGITDAVDSQLTLMEYAAWLVDTESENPADAETFAACDIDGDGLLTATDAQYILVFYAATLVGETPEWFDGLPDSRYQNDPMQPPQETAPTETEPVQTTTVETTVTTTDETTVTTASTAAETAVTSTTETTVPTTAPASTSSGGHYYGEVLLEKPNDGSRPWFLICLAINSNGEKNLMSMGEADYQLLIDYLDNTNSWPEEAGSYMYYVYMGE